MCCQKIKFHTTITTRNLPNNIKDIISKDALKYKKALAFNSGNILINNYFKKNIKYLEVDNKEYADKITLICANIVRPNIIKEGYLPTNNKWMNQYSGKIIALGIGAQANLESMKPKEYAKLLEKELIEWLKTLSDNTVSIGVRGEFTADVLNELGIKNVSVIGCPTWFVNGHNQPEIIKKEWSNNLKPACYTCWENYSDWHTAWNHVIVNEALKLKDPKFIMQSEFDILPYLLFNSNYFNLLNPYKYQDLQESMQYIKRTFKYRKQELVFSSKLRHLFKFFVNIPEWENFMKTRDFAYGMRIHGSVIALKQGVPAIAIAPDSRILEMCQLFKIPYLKVNEIESNNFNLQKLYEEADFDSMNKAYPKLLENYINFLNKNGLEHIL